MTPIEVMAEQVEPMLTLTTEDDINWMVVTSNPQPNALIPPPRSDKKTTEMTKTTTGNSEVMFRICVKSWEFLFHGKYNLYKIT